MAIIQSQQNVSLDLHNTNYIDIRAKQYNSGEYLDIFVTNNGIPLPVEEDVTVDIRIKTPDNRYLRLSTNDPYEVVPEGTEGAIEVLSEDLAEKIRETGIECEVGDFVIGGTSTLFTRNGASILVHLPQSVFLAYGKAVCEVTLTNENEETTMNLIILIEEAVYNRDNVVAEAFTTDEITQLRAEMRAYYKRAKESAEAAEDSAQRAKESEDNAKESELNAKTSEENAKESELNAKASEEIVVASVERAIEAETNSKASEEAAKESETNAKESETNAKASELAAKTSEDNAKISEDTVTELANEVATNTAKVISAEENVVRLSSETKYYYDSIQGKLIIKGTVSSVLELPIDPRVGYAYFVDDGSKGSFEWDDKTWPMGTMMIWTEDEVWIPTTIGGGSGGGSTVTVSEEEPLNQPENSIWYQPYN